MIEAKRTCENDKCRQVIPDTKGFFRASVEVFTINGVANTASAFTHRDFCSQGCFLAQVKAMVNPEVEGGPVPLMAQR